MSVHRVAGVRSGGVGGRSSGWRAERGVGGGSKGEAEMGSVGGKSKSKSGCAVRLRCAGVAKVGGKAASLFLRALVIF